MSNNNMETAENLRRMASRYREAADRLDAAADVLDGAMVNGEHQKPAPSPKPSRKVGRREQLQAFLRERGPTDRKSIVESTGIPLATVAYLLKPENGFRRVEYGMWDVNRKEDSDTSCSE